MNCVKSGIYGTGPLDIFLISLTSDYGGFHSTPRGIICRRGVACSRSRAKEFALVIWRSERLPWLENVTRASRPKRLPVVLSIAEVRSVLAQLDGTAWLLANVLYGGGLRLMEAHRLRVKDLVIERGEIIVPQARCAEIPTPHGRPAIISMKKCCSGPCRSRFAR